MAAGDAVIETGSVSGGSSVTVTVPTGERWAISMYGDLTNLHLNAYDGTNTPRLVAQGSGGLQQVAIFDDSVDPQLQQTACNSIPYYLGGREI